VEKMPYQPHLDSEPLVVPPPAGIVETNWRDGLPVLAGLRLTLRELRPSDAPSLLAMLTTEEVARFISPPPSSVEGFERFIAWTIRQRGAGDYACFAVVPKGSDHAVVCSRFARSIPGSVPPNGASRSDPTTGARECSPTRLPSCSTTYSA